MENLTINRIKKLVEQYEKSNKIIKSNKLKFLGVGNKDVYNISIPIISNSKKYLAGRVEKRKEWAKSETFFFEKVNDHWQPIEIKFKLEDPFHTKIDSQLVFGGVYVFPHSYDIHQSEKINFRTYFYKGKDIFNLEKFAEGPLNMKDIRLIELPNKKIGVFTRPEIKGWGKIGFTIINSLTELTPKIIQNAPLLKFNPDNSMWIGSNEIHLLQNSKLGIIGHAAYLSENNNRNYYPIAFIFDYKTKEVSNLKIIAQRKDLPKGEAKIRPKLTNVLFPGGIIRNKDRTATLYTGVSDAEAYEILIKDPFLEYEKEKEEN